MNYILHISYEIKLAPVLDNYILGALEEYGEDLDCMRDDETRDMYFYYESSEDLNKAETALASNGSKQLEDLEGECCLLDLIRVFSKEKDEIQSHKIRIKKRITEIHQKHSKKTVVNNEEQDII